MGVRDERLWTWIENLRQARPVFHSEADFQHALAWTAHLFDPSMQVRLETRSTGRTRLDLLLSRPGDGEHFALELKYLTAAWAGEAGHEHVTLVHQNANDTRSYDVVKDIQRVEHVVNQRPGWHGAVLVLTNDPLYWSKPRHGRDTNSDEFRLHEGQTISGTRSWGPKTGEGTMKGRETPIKIRHVYTCRWTDYAVLPGDRGLFKLLPFIIA